MAKWVWDAEPAELPAPPLVTVRPGPVMHVFHGGREVVSVALSPNDTIELCARLLAEIPRT